MKENNYGLRSFIDAAAVFLYIAAISWLLFNGKIIFGNQPDSFLAPVFMLLLFVISAATTGWLVLGKPILLYLDGLKKEALTMLFATLLWLVLFIVLVVNIILLQ